MRAEAITLNVPPETLCKDAKASRFQFRRTRLNRAFWISGMLFVLPVCALIYFVSTDLNARIEGTEKKRIGIEYLVPLLDLERSLQAYRAWTAVPGRGATRGPDPGFTIPIYEALQAVSAADKRLGGMLGVDQLWRQTEAEWRRIMSGLVGMDSAERQVATGALLQQIAVLTRDVADRSHLTLDADPDIYYLQEILTRNIPAAVRGITEARSSGLMSMLAEQLQESSERATAVDASFRPTVRSTAKAAHASLIDLATLAPTDPPVAGSAAVLPADAVALNRVGVEFGARSDAIVGALDSLLALARASAAALDESLAARMTDLRATLRARLALAAGFCFLAILALGALCRAQRRAAAERDREAQRVVFENKRSQQAILLLINELGEVAGGNLAARATVSAEMTGAIADSINVTIEALRDLVQGIDKASAQVKASTERGRAIANVLAVSTTDQSEQIKQTAASVQTMAQSIAEVSENASRCADVAMLSLNAANGGAEAVRSTIANMDEIRAQIQETAKRIKRLGESSQEIGDIVSLIDNITEQTNVLALNAAIQAAAGEAGRGFTIVAEEVQRLAERSTKATKEIAARVKSIQADTTDAVVAMEQSTNRVVEGTKLSVAVNQALLDIQNVTPRLANLVQSISVATQKQTEIAEQVSFGMTQILEVTDKTTAGAAQIVTSVIKLGETARTLRESVVRFRL
ncbi:MAG: Frizzy aggregation protein FrzCD [Chromatiales bacterium USCg_Taylor]|nr:MAG: Frizzy aggregation protein FrzCD [Chromatiales bacterium USCg_Taylor]